MHTSFQHIVFSIDSQRYALPLTAVERIIRVVEILPVPGAPPILLGVINVHGQMLPVFDVRRWLNLPTRDVELSDRLIIIRTKTGRAVLLVDTVDGVIKPSLLDIARAQSTTGASEYFSGILELDGDVMYICNLDALPLQDETLRQPSPPTLEK